MTERSVSLVFRDDGPGISPQVVDRLFEPFFTTKPAGQGTGLGLSTSQQIAKAHGGTLTVESTLNEGTAFTLTIPIGNALLDPAPKAAPPPE